ncbi:hypothetical protein [Stenotrophomonas maltophilia]|uniref:hypothetical protein n=1 Tax=Stenotrophomonas maltophilia group TaxID=995085 RepID=UPI000B0792EC|nr:hypothetical protein [Stenotrophomonas maltophilia]NNH47613.1 hypothetical protein [Stenotrophomonas maltophilia]
MLALLKSQNATAKKQLHLVLRTDNFILVEDGHGKPEHGTRRLYSVRWWKLRLDQNDEVVVCIACGRE